MHIYNAILSIPLAYTHFDPSCYLMCFLQKEFAVHFHMHVNGYGISNFSCA